MENQTENNDIDDIIVPTAPLYKQILNLYAEENAIEDTIFYLGEALRRGVIDLEVFLKVRERSLTFLQQCLNTRQELLLVTSGSRRKLCSNLPDALSPVAARASPVQEAVPASGPHAESPENSRPE